jgi:hypothetical protein
MGDYYKGRTLSRWHLKKKKKKTLNSTSRNYSTINGVSHTLIYQLTVDNLTFLLLFVHFNNIQKILFNFHVFIKYFNLRHQIIMNSFPSPFNYFELKKDLLYFDTKLIIPKGELMFIFLIRTFKQTHEMGKLVIPVI